MRVMKVAISGIFVSGILFCSLPVKSDVPIKNTWLKCLADYTELSDFSYPKKWTKHEAKKNVKLEIKLTALEDSTVIARIQPENHEHSTEVGGSPRFYDAERVLYAYTINDENFIGVDVSVGGDLSLTSISVKVNRETLKVVYTSMSIKSGKASFTIYERYDGLCSLFVPDLTKNKI